MFPKMKVSHASVGSGGSASVAKLRQALVRYDSLSLKRDEELSELAALAEQGGYYPYYDATRSDWADSMDEAGQVLACCVEEVLNSDRWA